MGADNDKEEVSLRPGPKHGTQSPGEGAVVPFGGGVVRAEWVPGSGRVFGMRSWVSSSFHTVHTRALAEALTAGGLTPREHQSAGGLVKTQVAGSPPHPVFPIQQIRLRPRICISNKFASQVDAAGPGSTR